MLGQAIKLFVIIEADKLIAISLIMIKKRIYILSLGFQ